MRGVEQRWFCRRHEPDHETVDPWRNRWRRRCGGRGRCKPEQQFDEKPLHHYDHAGHRHCRRSIVINHIPRAALFFALTVATCAQVRGPAMGYLPENGALRTLYGTPGAGSVGNAIPPDRILSLIEVSPAQSRALAVDANSGALVLLATGNGSTVVVAGVNSAPDRIVFSPTGT